MNSALQVVSCNVLLALAVGLVLASPAWAAADAAPAVAPAPVAIPHWSVVSSEGTQGEIALDTNGTAPSAVPEPTTPHCSRSPRRCVSNHPYYQNWRSSCQLPL
jgi:hypothetical protein